jgi:23S rRNA pseudouridine2457 synthase
MTSVETPVVDTTTKPATVVLLNKPFGVICQFSADGARATLRDFLPQREIYAAGRLDADSEGLVVLTADGGLQRLISDPRGKLAKTYYAQVEGVVTERALTTLRQGVTLAGYTSRPAQARAVEEPAWIWPRTPPIRVRREIPTAWIELQISEGKNRQVRHMTAAVGLPTLRLVRYAVGPWNLDGLLPGKWREADAAELPQPRAGRTRPRPRARQ